MKNATLREKPDAGNPHVRSDEGKVAPVKPRRGSLLCKLKPCAGALAALCGLGLSAADWKSPVSGSWTDADNWVDGTLPSSAACTYITNRTGSAGYTVTLEDEADVTNSTKGLTLKGKAESASAAPAYTAVLNVKSPLVSSAGITLADGANLNIPAGGCVTETGWVSTQRRGQINVTGGSLSAAGLSLGYTDNRNWDGGNLPKLTISSGSVSLKTTGSSAPLSVQGYSQLAMTGGKLDVSAASVQNTAFISHNWSGSSLLSLSGDSVFTVSGGMILGVGNHSISGNARLTGYGQEKTSFSLRPYYSDSNKTINMTVSGNSRIQASGYGYCEVGKEHAKTTGTVINLNIQGGTHSFGFINAWGIGTGTYSIDISGGSVTFSGYGLWLGSMPLAPAGEDGNHFRNKTTMKVRNGGVLTVAGNQANGPTPGKNLWGFCIGQGLCYDRSDYMFDSRLEIMDGGVVTNGHTSQKSPIFVGAGYATGVVHQTGGRFDAIEGDLEHTWNRTVGSLVLGLYGGYGAYEISGGTAKLVLPAYIGGAPVTVHQSYGGCGRSMTNARLPTNYAGKSVGLLKVSGGTMSISHQTVVGYDGTGTVELSGNGRLTFGGNLILTNSAAVAEASTLKFTLTDAAQPKLAIGGAMKVFGDARLVVDATDCHAAGGTLYQLCSSTGTSDIFPVSQITLKDDGHGQLKITSKGIWYRRKGGFAVYLR